MLPAEASSGAKAPAQLFYVTFSEGKRDVELKILPAEAASCCLKAQQEGPRDP